MDKSFLNIDINRLDDEWLRQPHLYGEIADQLAEARRSLEQAKARLEITRAQIADEVRTNPKDYGIDRVSQPKVEAAVNRHRKVRLRTKSLIQAQYEVNVLQGAAVAMDHKKRALENLVKLHGQNYFSSPTASSDDREAVEDMVKKSARGRRKSRA